MLFPLGSIGPVRRHRSMIRCFFHRPRIGRLLRRGLRRVNSLRHVVSGMTINHISPHRIMRLGITLHTVRPVGRTYATDSRPDLYHVNRRLGTYTLVHSQVRGRVGGSPPSLLGQNNIVTANIGTRLSRLHTVTCSNGSCLLGMRTQRVSLANVSDLGVNFGGIFKCCVRIHGTCGSGIPTR